MNVEFQNIEIKDGWCDKYLKWICGFNVWGGALYVDVGDGSEVCVETLLGAHGSHPYNPDIANTFFRAGEIEAWGRGIERIVKACQEGGFSIPEFRCDASGIWTVFKFVYPSLDSALDSALDTSQKTNQKTNQKIDRNLTDQQNDIIKYLREHPYATQKELCENIPNAALGGIRHNLARLQELGILKRIGGRKLGHWEIV